MTTEMAALAQLIAQLMIQLQQEQNRSAALEKELAARPNPGTPGPASAPTPPDAS